MKLILFLLLSSTSILSAQQLADNTTDELAINFVYNDGTEVERSLANHKGEVVYISFWASWCKNCKVMDHSTLENARVQERLQEYTFIKYVAEDLLDEETKAVLDHFNVQGLPTFIVLEPIGL